MLQLSNAPRRAWENLLMAYTDQEQIGQPPNPTGLLDASLLRTDLVLAQPEVRLQLAVDLFHWPPSLVRPYHLSRNPLVQIGHQDFRLFGAEVTPSLTQNHSDITDVPQTQARAIHPEGFAALSPREPGHPRTLIIFAWQMRHQVFHGLIFDRFPRAGNGEHQAPPTSRIVGGTLHDHLQVVLRAIRRVALDNDARSPGWWDKALHHLTKQRIFRLVRRIGFAPNQAKSHREAIDVPRGNQQGKADAKKPRLMLAFPPFWGQGILCPPLGFDTAIPHQMECPVLGWGQGLQRFRDPPRHQHMDIPIRGFEQPAKAPDGDRARRPASQFFQGFPPWKQGLHDDEPTQDETVTTFPHTGHAAKQQRDAQGQIGNRDHSWQHRNRSGEHPKSTVSGRAFYHIAILPLVA